MTMIKRWDILVSTMQMSRMQEYLDGDYVRVSDLLSGHVLEHEGKQYVLKEVEKMLPDCPHAAPFRYCDGCKVSPCPIGMDKIQALAERIANKEDIH